MTNVTYPSGLFLQFAYGVGNRRTQVTDQAGFTVNYSYNSLGQLVDLSDVSSNVIVKYAYDLIGRLASKSFANGAVTTNSYTSTGLLQSVVNMGPDGTVVSSFNYGYDPLGRVTSMTTLDGTFAYAYDADNQLVSASLSSGRAIQYQYDGAGNRLSVVDGGTNSAYAVNALNEYSSAGAASFSYDADGNVISKTDATGTTAYTYDDLKRLVSLTSPAGTWSYQYNALGQRTASTFNGQQTDYVVDPAGLGNVVGEYQTSGALVAHYIFGLDLTSRVDSSGNPAYYAFDGNGNTVDLIDSAGAVQNSYSYLPFGEKLTATGSTSNLFTFAGRIGVTDDGDGFYFMRHRSYDPAVGHFAESDPTGIAGGTLNLYEYANNNPVMETDATGLGLLSYLWSLVPGSSSINLANQAVQTANQAVAAGQTRNDIYGAILNPSTTDQQLAGYSETSGGAVGGSIQPALTSTAGLTASGASYAYAVPFNTVANSPSPFSPLSIAPNAVNNGLAALSPGSGGPNGPGGPSPSAPPSSDPPPPGGNPPSGGGGNGIPPGGSGPGGSGTGGPLPPPGPNNQPPPCPTCPPGPGPGPGGSIFYPGSADPNDKVTSGVGNQGYVADSGSIFYTVDFANETNATAPAAQVVVTDQLDTNLNWATFEFESISFNNVTIPVPDGVQSFVTTANVSTDPNPVQVTATFNPATGLITWVMESIDPVTGHLVTDPLAGFLPPDNAQEQGEGYVTYSVETKAGLATGTQIKNQATIVFDANASIATPVTTNTVVATPPTSSMTALPATSPTTFTVSWSGQDVGPGIAGFNIFVSTNGGPWTPWILGATNTSALFTGTSPNAYAFYSVAYDEVGNVQANPVIPGASTAVSSSAVTSVPISIARSGTGTVTLTWLQGTLLQATNLGGPWTTNAATSPYVVAPTNSQTFFELLEN
jgi:RHS repeat-associated protein